MTMQLQKAEAPNHTPEQVREIIVSALALSDELGTDDRSRQAIFEQACLLLGQKSVTFVAEQPMPAFAIPRNHRG